MEDLFIKFYALVSLWFWAGMLLSTPFRKAFAQMHLRILKQAYNATWGQAVKVFRKFGILISRHLKRVSLHVDSRVYEMRVKSARLLVSKKLLDELTQKNFIEAIARARGMDQADSGTPYEELEKFAKLITGKSMSAQNKKTAIKTAFKLSGTVLLKDIITKMPYAQERVLLAFEQAEGSAPYESIKSDEFRKFIRQ